MNLVKECKNCGTSYLIELQTHKGIVLKCFNCSYEEVIYSNFLNEF